jgi:ribosomal protein S18 acetylase RimI-like enzyme
LIILDDYYRVILIREKEEKYLNLYKCSQANLDEVIQIGRKTYYDTFHATNSEETMEKYLDEAFDPIKINEQLKNPDSHLYFLYAEDTVVAYLKVNLPPSQTDYNDPDSLELERIYVKSEHKGHGYGTFLIDATISMAKEFGCKYVWLGVWEHNEQALAFYRKMGFTVFDQHSFRMGDEIQNDFVLSRYL